MFTYAWPTVIQKMTQVLDIYPRVWNSPGLVDT